MTGEPGIGKTRLLEELGLRAADRGALVVSGRAAEYEVDLPLAVWIDALEPHVAATGAPDLSERDAASLAEALPSLAHDPGATVPERHRVHAAMRSLLAALAKDRPLVVVLDDLHWADPASVDLIAALLRRPPAAEVLLALSSRRHQAPERLEVAFARALREHRGVELVLAPLDLVATTSFLGADTPERTRDLLYLESGGNPFYLEHLARSLDDGAPVARASGEVELPGVPHAVSAALAEERGALAPDVRTVLDAAAIVGVDFEPDTVATVAGVAEGDALDALDALVAAGLVRPSAETRRFTMRHPLVRRAIYDTTGAGWRLAAHARAAAALLESGAPPEAYAHHVAVSAHAGDEDAVAVLAGAASGVRARAPASAARWYEDALRLLPEGAPSRRRELLSSLADAQAAAGRLEDADAVLETAIATLALTEVRERVGLTVTRARFEHLRGSLDAAHARLEAALADLPGDADAEELALVITLAVDAFHRRDVEAVRHWGGRAEELGRGEGRPAHAAAGLALCALVDALVGDVESALRRCDDAARLFDDLPDAELAECLEAAQFIGLAEMYVERYDQAAAHGRRGIAVARATGEVQRVSVLTISQGFATAMLGRLHEARELLDGAVESTRLLHSDFALAWVMMNAALVDLLAGNLHRGPGQGDGGRGHHRGARRLGRRGERQEPRRSARARGGAAGRRDRDAARRGRRTRAAAHRRVLEGLAARVADHRPSRDRRARRRRPRQRGWPARSRTASGFRSRRPSPRARWPGSHSRAGTPTRRSTSRSRPSPARRRPARRSSALVHGGSRARRSRPRGAARRRSASWGARPMPSRHAPRTAMPTPRERCCGGSATCAATPPAGNATAPGSPRSRSASWRSPSSSGIDARTARSPRRSS